MRVQPSLSSPLGYRQVTGLNTLKTLADGQAIDGVTTGIPTGAQYCIIQVESQVVRWTDDGSIPTATKGMRIAAGGELFCDVAQLSALKFLEEAASAKLNVAFYKPAR